MKMKTTATYIQENLKSLKHQELGATEMEVFKESGWQKLSLSTAQNNNNMPNNNKHRIPGMLKAAFAGASSLILILVAFNLFLMMDKGSPNTKDKVVYTESTLQQKILAKFAADYGAQASEIEQAIAESNNMNLGAEGLGPAGEPSLTNTQRQNLSIIFDEKFSQNTTQTTIVEKNVIGNALMFDITNVGGELEVFKTREIYSPNGFRLESYDSNGDLVNLSIFTQEKNIEYRGGSYAINLDNQPFFMGLMGSDDYTLVDVFYDLANDMAKIVSQENVAGREVITIETNRENYDGTLYRSTTLIDGETFDLIKKTVYEDSQLISSEEIVSREVLESEDSELINSIDVLNGKEIRNVSSPFNELSKPNMESIQNNYNIVLLEEFSNTDISSFQSYNNIQDDEYSKAFNDPEFNPNALAYQNETEEFDISFPSELASYSYQAGEYYYSTSIFDSEEEANKVRLFTSEKEVIRQDRYLIDGFEIEIFLYKITESDELMPNDGENMGRNSLNTEESDYTYFEAEFEYQGKYYLTSLTSYNEIVNIIPDSFNPVVLTAAQAIEADKNYNQNDFFLIDDIQSVEVLPEDMRIFAGDLTGQDLDLYLLYQFTAEDNNCLMNLLCSEGLSGYSFDYSYIDESGFPSMMPNPFEEDDELVTEYIPDFVQANYSIVDTTYNDSIFKDLNTSDDFKNLINKDDKLLQVDDFEVLEEGTIKVAQGSIRENSGGGYLIMYFTEKDGKMLVLTIFATKEANYNDYINIIRDAEFNKDVDYINSTLENGFSMFGMGATNMSIEEPSTNN